MSQDLSFLPLKHVGVESLKPSGAKHFFFFFKNFFYLFIFFLFPYKQTSLRGLAAVSLFPESSG